MAVNLGEFEVDPSTGEYRRVVRSSDGGEPPRGRKARSSKGKGLFLSILITILFGAIYYYFELPALNIHSGSLYVFIILLCAVFFVCEIIISGFRGDTPRSYFEHVRKQAKIPFFIVCLCIVTVVIGSILGWKVFRAHAYASLMTVETGDFAADVAEVSFNQIPMLDKDSANVLANRKLGELSDLVSQFEVYRDSYQINYQNKPVRVTYLYYGDFFKWWNNQRAGIPAYLIIDMVTQEVTVQRLENGIRYSPSEYFFRDIDRYLAFKYPTKIFSNVNFDVDDEGNPYWVATVITKKVGLFGGADAIGAVLVNAATGESQYYDVSEIPTWVDRVYNADLILQQYNYYGIFQNGFLNSIFGQRGCTMTTEGYNYIAQDDDVWLYTGITSVSGDQGNIGFILVNQRTKESRYYSCAGAEEYSAMSSAEGAVQQYAYEATFPLLLNIGGQPTYFMALKDDSSLVKMYAMVNVSQYQIVATGASVVECMANYEKLLISSGIVDDIGGKTPTGSETVSGIVAEIRTAVIGGNTRYYIRLEDSAAFFGISASDAPEAIILNVGDRVTITYSPGEDAILNAGSVTIK